MKQKEYSFLTSKEIRPLGWLKRQLEIQASGLAGNLDKIWPDIRDSKWIGGDREGWERIPYWLDGFIPLAFLLDDEDMKARAERIIDAILARQEPDGWICPNGDTPRDKYDIWATHLITKTLTVWYDCTSDERIPEVLYRIMKNFMELSENGGITINDWGKYRWFEGVIALRYLAKWYPEKNWIREAAAFLEKTGADYDAVSDMWKRPLNKSTFDTHVVNLAMMLKSEAVMNVFSDNEYKDLAENRYDILMKYNGMPAGTFTGDECLAGISPIQGTELCGVVELMYSFEWLFAVTGENKWAERLEKVAFNALPAATTDDMWAHQYDQMTNQIECVPFPGRPIFRTNSSESHVFGLEPNFGCCTANFGQGWPKFALSAFMKSGDGLINVVPLPSEASINYKGADVTVRLETEYPWKNRFVYRVTASEKTDMKLRIRIPSFAKLLKVNGTDTKKRGTLVFDGFGKGETTINISYEIDPVLKKSRSGLYTAERGSLLYSLKIDGKSKKVEYTRDNVERKYPYCDYYIKCAGKWNYGFASKKLSFEERSPSYYPFSSDTPPALLKAKLVEIDWGEEDGFERVPARLPASRKPVGGAIELQLIPYGCAKLRMTELPLVNFDNRKTH